VLVNTNGRDIPHARTIEAELGAAILGLRSPASAPDVAVPPEQLEAWQGTYGGSFGGRPAWIVHTLDGLHDNILRRVNAP
jgi:hypothetical protein